MVVGYRFFVLGVLLGVCVVESHLFGTNIHFTTPLNGEMDMLSAVGWNFVRMDFTWSATEQQKGVYDFSSYDILMANLATYNMRAILILDYANPLYDDGLSVHTDEGREAFTNWAMAGVGRYQNRSVFWEMYNEPNIDVFWKPTPNVTDYIALATSVGKAIKSLYPGEIFIGPATSQMDWTFLEGCFQGGLLNYFDYVSVHPYRSNNPESVTEDFATLTSMIAQYSPSKQVPIVSSEWGYSELYSGLSLELQGKYAPRMMLNNQLNGIVLSIWYDWHDDCTDTSNLECYFGTTENEYYPDRTPCYDPKPNYIALQTLAYTLQDFTFSGTIKMEPNTDIGMLFTNDQEETTAVAAWSTTTHTHTSKISIPAGCYDMIDYLGNNQGSVCTKGTVTLQLEDSPLYLVPQ
ncbi:cellulase family glycosylhydrolase [Pelomyxa schiedti]|nr:cellulase family glycosylhydrolase [Pelomyxa schiedti]